VDRHFRRFSLPAWPPTPTFKTQELYDQKKKIQELSRHLFFSFSPHPDNKAAAVAVAVAVAVGLTHQLPSLTFCHP
jgi:hypothetical protein